MISFIGPALAEIHQMNARQRSPKTTLSEFHEHAGALPSLASLGALV